MQFDAGVVLLAISLILAVRSTVVYKTINMECLPNAKYIRNTTCKLRAINWYKAVSNMDCDIVGKLRNVSVHFEVYAKNYANVFKPFIINVTSNACDMVGKKIFPAYSMIALNILKEVSNLNHTCPYSGHIKAFNLYVPERFIPNFLPFGVYKMVFHFMEGYPYDDVGTVILYVEAIEKDDLHPKRKRKRLQHLT